MTREEWATAAIKGFIANFPEKAVTIICHEEENGKDKALICMTSGAHSERREADLYRILKEFPESRQIVDGETGEVIRDETGQSHLGKMRLNS